MTFTATRPLSPTVNGSLTVPARCSHTPGLNSAFSDFFRLSQAAVRGKKTCAAQNTSPL